MNEIAQIFLADQRGCSETTWFRSFHGFNFGNYQAESREPFGVMTVLNDETLAGQNHISMTVEENTTVVLLPIVGDLVFKNSLGEDGFIEAGQVQVLRMPAQTTFQLSNPYTDDLINFLQIHFSQLSESTQQSTFDISIKNSLHQLFLSPSLGFIGKYDGRTGDIYTLRNPRNGLFIFVIEGVFEAQNRLLHARDGLSLQNIETIDFEALSNEAILLLLEIPSA